MTRPLDDLHPIEREMVHAIDEGTLVMRTHRAAGDKLLDDAWRPILASNGITGEDAEAFIRVVNGTCRAMAEEEHRRFANPTGIACQVFMNLLLGIRLARRGLVGAVAKDPARALAPFLGRLSDADRDTVNWIIAAARATERNDCIAAICRYCRAGKPLNAAGTHHDWSAVDGDWSTDHHMPCEALPIRAAAR